MYQIPIPTNVLVPTTTIKTTSYPTTFLLNTVAPSILYESRLTAPVYSTGIPVLGYETHVNCCSKISKVVDKNIEDEKNLDEFIKSRVEYQIKKFQVEQEQDKLNKRKLSNDNTQSKENINRNDSIIIDQEIRSKCNCHCKCMNETKELTLDEKIAKIREELNLPNEKEQDKLIQKLKDYQTKYDECMKKRYCPCCEYQYENESCEHHHKHDLKKKNQVNVMRSRSRSKSADSHSRHRSSSAKSTRSKSPSSAIYKPPWIPTGANDYSSTNWKRADLIVNQRNKYENSGPQNSLVFFDHPIKNHNETKSTQVNYEPVYSQAKNSSYVTFDTVKPAKTIIKTTVESNKYVKSNPAYYCTTNYVTEHLPTVTKSYSRPTTSLAEPYYYQKTNYPLAKEYYYHPIERTKSYTNLKPIERTNNGTFYSGSKNDIHYVSNNARGNLASNKTIQYKINNSGSTFIHE